MVSERGETSEVSCTIAPAYCLESFQVPVQERETRQSLEVSLSWGDRDGTYGGPRQLEFAAQGSREKRNAQSESSGDPHTNQLMHEKKPPQDRATTTGRGMWDHPWSLYSPVIVPVPPTCDTWGAE